MFYRLAVVVIFFLSGAAGLIYQVSWTRQIGVQLGHTVQSASIVLASFFVGAALGYWSGSRLAKRSSPLIGYAVAELGVALWAVAIPLLLRSAEAWELARTVGEFSLGGRTAVSAAACFLLLLPATFALGFTLPLMAGAVAGQRKGGLTDSTEAGRVSFAYAANTAGALVGTLLATFVLLVGVGVAASSYLAAGLSAICAFAAVAVSRFADRSEEREAPVPSERPPSPATAQGFWIGLAALSGFGTLALEALYTRLFSLVFHNSSYSFGVVVAAFLASLAGGAALAGILQKRASAIALAGIAAGLGGMAVPISVLTFVGMTRLEYFRAGESFIGYMIAASGLALLVVGPPITLLGMALPAAWKGAGADSAPGEVVGRLTAANSLAAAAGALVASFLLLPRAGLWLSFAIIALLFAAVGVALFVRSGRRLVAGVAAVAFAGLVLLAIRVPAEVEASTQPGEEVVRRWNSAYGWIDLTRDRESGAYRVRQNLHYRFGRTGQNRREFRQSQLQLLLHPNPEEALFLGLGTGLTAGGSIPHDEVKSVVAVELIPEVVEAAAELGEYNNGVATHPKVEVVIDDARHYLQTTDRSFDVIVSDLFVPWESETGYLYTVEHFRAGRDRLKAGGIYCQWLPVYQLGEREFESIANSFASVFPVVTLWWGDLEGSFSIVALVGSDRPIELDAEALKSRIASLQRRSGSVDEAIRTPERIFENYLGDWTLREGAELNTDEHPRVEFLTPVSNRDRTLLSGALLREYFDRVLAKLPAENAELSGAEDPSDQADRRRRSLQRFILQGGEGS